MDLDELIALIREHWPAVYHRGRVTHLHRNSLTTKDGARVHLRVMIQTIVPAPINVIAPDDEPPTT
jgi:hypothetical protein